MLGFQHSVFLCSPACSPYFGNRFLLLNFGQLVESTVLGCQDLFMRSDRIHHRSRFKDKRRFQWGRDLRLEPAELAKVVGRYPNALQLLAV